MKKSFLHLIGVCFLVMGTAASVPEKTGPVRVLVITGGHDYNKEEFNGMLTAMGDQFSCTVMEFPGAFDMFLPENQGKYDVLVFYHMWQDIGKDQMEAMAGCIHEGKPLVVLHHSICAFDNWDEYIQIVGGKYFHQSKNIGGRQYPASSYEHDRNIPLLVVNTGHPVTKGLRDFTLFDETYKDFYVMPGVKPLLRTTDPTSSPVVAWAHQYGKSRVVTIQSGHDTPTYRDANYRTLLRQAVLWVYHQPLSRTTI